jgi:hypothetical protein
VVFDPIAPPHGTRSIGFLHSLDIASLVLPGSYRATIVRTPCDWLILPNHVPSFFSQVSAHHILGEPDPAPGIHKDPYADTVERGAGQVNEVPACWSLVHHTFLDALDTSPCRRIGSSKADILAAVCKAGETFISDAGTLIESIGASVAEAAVIHIPAVQSRASGKGRIPDKGVKATDCAVVIDQRKKLLSQLNLFC